MSQDPGHVPPPPGDAPPPAAAAPPPPPPPGGDAGGGEGPRLPWEERDRLGFLDALIETTKLLFTAPANAFSRLRPDGDLIWPLIFGLIFSWFGQMFSQIWGLIFGGAMQSMMGGFDGLEEFAIFGATSAFQSVFILIIWPIFYVIFTFIFAGIYHLCLMLVGGVERSPLGFEGTLKVVAYSHVGQLAAVVPVFGGLIVFVISVVLTVIGFTAAHKTTQGKAIIAVLIPIAFCCICGMVMMMMFGAALMAAVAGGAAAS